MAAVETCLKQILVWAEIQLMLHMADISVSMLYNSSNGNDASDWQNKASVCLHMPKESILIVKGKECFYFWRSLLKKHYVETMSIYLSICDLVSATRPLVRLS